MTCIQVSSMSLHGLMVYFFLVLNNSSLSGCTTVYPSLTEEHLGPFQVWAVMHKAAINIFVQVLCGCRLSALLGKYQELVFVGSYSKDLLYKSVPGPEKEDDHMNKPTYFYLRYLHTFTYAKLFH